MKIKQILMILFVCVTAIITSSIYAETYEHFIYTVSNNEVTITEYDGTATNNLVIPAEIDKMPVTKLGNAAFENQKNIVGELLIPDTVKSIGNNCFYNCSGFTGSLIIPDSIETISSFAFAH